MRINKCSPYGEEVDLDDPQTYNYLPKTIKELRDLMFREIGYSICYMDFWNRDVFHEMESVTQRGKVEALIKSFTENEKQNYENLSWYQEQVFLFQDAIENMC